LYFPCDIPSKGLGADEDSAAAVPSGAKGGSGATCGGIVGAIASTARAAAAQRSPPSPSQSKGMLLKAAAGTAVVHSGNIMHAGDRVESGERLQLVAFFYGNERRGNALPNATETLQEAGSAPPTVLSAPPATVGSAATQRKGPSNSPSTPPPPPAVREPHRILGLSDVAALLHQH
jgi:hypothetical protein